MNSSDAFVAVEKQARSVLVLYHDYCRGPRIQSDTGLSRLEMGLAIGCIPAIIAYAFTLQSEFYLGMAMFVGILGVEGWKAGALAMIGAGVMSSFLLTEVIPFTRQITKPAPAVIPDRRETLIGQILGEGHRKPNNQKQFALFTFGLISVILTVIIFFAVRRSVEIGDLGIAFMAPSLFGLDCLLGIGPSWLLIFVSQRLYLYWRNWRARTKYARLEEAWNLMQETYTTAQSWYFQEHPELEQQQDRLPAVSPLAGFIITHPCHEDIEIPEHILKPSTAPHKTNNKPPDNDGHSPEKTESLDNPADLFSAMDSDSEANDVTI